jgi:hypothetical protein
LDKPTGETQTSSVAFNLKTWLLLEKPAGDWRTEPKTQRLDQTYDAHSLALWQARRLGEAERAQAEARKWWDGRERIEVFQMRVSHGGHESPILAAIPETAHMISF